MEQFFKLKENGTNVSTEFIAGMTTFFTMSYIIFVNPMILSQTGMPWGGVYLATILAAMIGTLVMGLFANVPYAQAAGMGLNAFFTYTVVFGLGFSWQQALAMVFLCGLINILITVTRIRKQIILAIPKGLQNAISGGIGLFIGYIGLKNAGFLSFLADPGTYVQLDSGTIIANSSVVPSVVAFNNAPVLLALFALVLTVVLLVMKVKGAILLGILISTAAGIPMGVVDLSAISGGVGVAQAFAELGTTIGAAVGPQGMLSLFGDAEKLPLVLITIFSFSLTDTFDTIGTFIGTGRRSGIFSEEDEKLMMQSAGFQSKMDRALFADAIATSVGALLGTSNTTTYVESASGIAAGGRTGFTSVVVAALFGIAIFLAPIAQLVPAQATAAALIVVGIMMCASFRDVEWGELEAAIPAFFAAVFMAFAYSISNGIAAGFIFYVIVSVAQGQAKKVHPIVWGATFLFILNFALAALF